ncbi:MAG: GMC family oxidoreductase N-terminal domain-containing protein [Pseudomonadota bacterium]
MSDVAFDFIVVGAGSAGCALVDTLSADGRYSVCVLEAGGSDRKWSIKMPVGYAFTFNDASVNWKYWTEPDPGLADRKAYWPRGKVLGGSSSINAMLYCRGLSNDYNDWSAAGASGWDWSSVRGVYESMEHKTHRGQPPRGGGPLYVTDDREQCHPVNAEFMQAAAEAGWPLTEDYNHDGHEEGLCYFHATTHNGRRWSAADAFLRPALKRDNVTLMTDTLVAAVELEDGVASGVALQDGRRLRARKEVILSAGAVSSPVILQRSGIGPGALLQSHGVPVQADLPAVGQHMQDHLAVTYFYHSHVPTLNSELSPLFGRVKAALRYAFGKRGPLSLPVNQFGGFMRSQPELDAPDMQIYCNPVTYSSGGGGEFRPRIDAQPGFILSFCPCRPTSRGAVEMASPSPEDAPRIQPNSLQTDKDIEDVRRGGALIRQLTGAPTLQRIIRNAFSPHPDMLDDEGLVQDFRERAGTNFHPSCTCKMGRDASDSVTDARLRVHGIGGLRVADASSFPNITSANTNAPSMMVGRRAGQLILEDHA